MNDPTLYQTFDSKTDMFLDDRWCETEQEYCEYLRYTSEQYGECYTVAVENSQYWTIGDQQHEDNALYYQEVGEGIKRFKR